MRGNGYFSVLGRNQAGELCFTLGAAGKRTNVLELNNRNAAYGYDNDYRLTSEAITADPSGNNGTVNYVYDSVGNRFSMTSTLNAVPGGSFFYDNNDRLTTDTYDANGNTTSSAGISKIFFIFHIAFSVPVFLYQSRGSCFQQVTTVG